MQKCLHKCKIFCNFVADFKMEIVNDQIVNILTRYIMEGFMKYLGVILLLLGVLCLVLYKFAAPENWLLICSMVLEVGGILAYIFINKHLG